MPAIRGIMNKIAAEEKRYYMTGMKSDPWYRRCFYAVLCFFSVFVTEINAFRIFVRVASGTYTTMLALVPFTIVGGSLVLTFNKKVNVQTLVSKIYEFVSPVAGNDVSTFLSESLTRTLDLGLGPVGVVSLIVTSVMLFVHIEDCVNDIWHVTKPRMFYLRILSFYAVVTLGPILLSFSMYQMAEFMPEEVASGFWWKMLLETAMLSVVLSVTYKFLPNTRVRLKYAVIPAILVAVLLEVVKLGFGYYLSVAFSSSYSILYGALGIIPVTLLWVYLSWAVVLLGVEAGYCMQNLKRLLLGKFYDSRASDDNPWIFMGAYAPIEILAAMVRNLCAGQEPMTSEEIASECVYPVQGVEAILTRLESRFVVRQVTTDKGLAYILARPLDALHIREIMTHFDESSPRVRKYPKLAAMVEQLVEAQNKIWSGCNGNELREDGVALKDVAAQPTVTSLHVDE